VKQSSNPVVVQNNKMHTILVDVSMLIAKSKQACAGKYGKLWLQIADDSWVTYWPTFGPKDFLSNGWES
jgi:hypothetical protein